MTQMTIGQRIKFIMDAHDLSIRKIARTLDVSDTNIRNYIARDSKPSSDVLEKILRSFPQVNPAWLLTGEGEPLFSKTPDSGELSTTSTKNNSGNSIGINHGKASQQQGTSPSPTEAALLQKIEYLEAQLVMKDQVIASKQESIDLLKAAYGRPN
ncbi:MAG: hypothetical protein JWP58_1060 [Hymenobacter sp.]|nr:hypothetical protein [Hymenobacter sp.]